MINMKNNLITLIVFLSIGHFTFAKDEFWSHSVINYNEIPIHQSGPKLRREYPGGEMQYQPIPISIVNMVNTIRTPILPTRSRSSSQDKSSPEYLSLLPQYSEKETYSCCCCNDVKRNKKLTVKFFQEVIGNKITTNLEKFVSPNFIQHTQEFANGIEGLRQALSQDGVLAGPPEKITFLHVTAEYDLVWLHTTSKKGKTPGLDDVDLSSSSTGFDLFRIECGKIAEHWKATGNTELDANLPQVPSK